MSRDATTTTAIPRPAPVRARARVSPWRAAGIVAGVFVALLLFAEAGLRFAGYANYERYLPDPELLWILEPEQQTVTHFGHKPVFVNSHGMRGDEFAREKPAGTTRVICFGDSFTYGYGVGQDETYPAQLDRLVKARLGPRYEVFNAGVNGYGTFQEVLAFERALQYQPDVVVISSTYNDDQFIRQLESRNGRFGLSDAESHRIQRGVRMKRIVRRFALYNFGMEAMAQNVYNRVRVRLVAGTWSLDAPLNTSLYKHEAMLTDIVRTARARGIDVIFLIPHHSDLGPYGEIMVRTAERARVPAVVMRPVFARYPDERTYFIVDHGHPNAFGQGLIANEILEILRARQARGTAR